MPDEYGKIFKSYPARLSRQLGVDGSPLYPGSRAVIQLVDSTSLPHEGWTVAQENLTKKQWEVVVDTSNLELHPSEGQALETAQMIASRCEGRAESFFLTSYYACDACDAHWDQNWPGTPNDECPSCETPDISPYYHHPSNEPCNEEERASFATAHLGQTP